MSALVKWWSRGAAAVTGLMLTLVVPVHAWAASNGVADVATEAVRYRRRRSGFGFVGLLGGLCCLFVVAAIVLVILLVRRGRRRPK
jgi:succinate dehydrogenase hydrophobic anchor subunit